MRVLSQDNICRTYCPNYFIVSTSTLKYNYTSIYVANYYDKCNQVLNQHFVVDIEPTFTLFFSR